MTEQLLEPITFLALFLRLLLGILFFFQGYDKVFKIGLKGVINTVGPSYRNRGLPDFSISIVSFLTSWIELTCGLLLIAGLFKYIAIYLLGLDLLIVVFGMSLLEPVWDMKLVFPRLVLYIILLLLPCEKDIFTMDNLLF